MILCIGQLDPSQKNYNYLFHQGSFESSSDVIDIVLFQVWQQPALRGSLKCILVLCSCPLKIYYHQFSCRNADARRYCVRGRD
jgi:hypothetical protein